MALVNLCPVYFFLAALNGHLYQQRRRPPDKRDIPSVPGMPNALAWPAFPQLFRQWLAIWCALVVTSPMYVFFMEGGSSAQAVKGLHRFTFKAVQTSCTFILCLNLPLLPPHITPRTLVAGLVARATSCSEQTLSLSLSLS